MCETAYLTTKESGPKRALGKVAWVIDELIGRRCEVGGMVSCRLNVSWVLPSYFTPSCVSHLGFRDPLPDLFFPAPEFNA